MTSSTMAAALPVKSSHEDSAGEKDLSQCWCFLIICCLYIILMLVVVLSLIYLCVAIALDKPPHPPQFSITNLHIINMNFTTYPDSITLLNLTLTVKNPDNDVTLSYDPFSLTAYTGAILIGKGSLPAFKSHPNTQTTLQSILSDDRDLNMFLTPYLKKKGFPVVIQMETKVKLSYTRWYGEESSPHKVRIRVECDGIKGMVLGGNNSSEASVKDSKCKMDLYREKSPFNTN